jgi:hypothetical protein
MTGISRRHRGGRRGMGNDKARDPKHSPSIILGSGHFVVAYLGHEMAVLLPLGVMPMRRPFLLVAPGDASRRCWSSH